MDIIFTNSENNKTSEPQKVLFKLTDKADLRRSVGYVVLWNPSIYMETIKSCRKTINLKYQLQR